MTRPTLPCPTPRCANLQPCKKHPRIPFGKRSMAAPVTARLCPEPHCFTTLPCEKHEHKPFEGAPRTGVPLYKTAEWRRESKAFLATFPECVVDGSQSSIVDHRVPHRGDETLFWARDNWQPMCHHCHNKKTAREIMQRKRERSLAVAKAAHDS